MGESLTSLVVKPLDLLVLDLVPILSAMDQELVGMATLSLDMDSSI